MVPLGAVATFVRGVTFKPTDVESPTVDNIDCLRTKNVQDDLDLSDVWSIPRSMMKRLEQRVRKGDILVSSANSWNLVGKCSWIPSLERTTTFGGFVTILRADSDLADPRYLYRWFSWERTQATIRSFGNQTTNISNLNLKRTAALNLPLPPLDEQRRIAAILDKADALRTTRWSVLMELSRLERSTFLHMFGDPVSVPERRELATLLSSIDSGSSPVAEDRIAGPDEWGILKLSAVTSQTFIASENKAIDAEKIDRRHEIRSGDVLFTRKNTPSLVAATALVRSTRPKLLLPDLVFRLNIANRGTLLPEYLHAVLSYPTQRAAIQKLASGSAASMSNISKTKLLTASIPVPRIEDQRRFKARLDSVNSLRGRAHNSLNVADRLFASLQHRAFSGEL
ncbi:restriction endonuclease subunit S [Sinomonas flava]|uniref:restriction endonuclease subunit S n=1 Tax=Sinomonas flava TaxID=496857 RepID=UPI0039A6985D